jgi:hypothetical protein
MQRNRFTGVFVPSSLKKAGFWLRMAGFAALLIYITRIIHQQSSGWPLLRDQLIRVRYPAVWGGLLVGLAVLNWLLEARKWQLLLRPVAPVGLTDALRGVLAGLSLGLALPTQIGDAAGRVLSLRRGQAGQRAEATGAALLSGGLQYYVSLTVGAIGWAWQWHTLPARHTPVGTTILLTVTSLVLAGVVLALLRRRLVAGLTRVPGLRRGAGWWAVAGQYDRRTMLTAFGLALARHLVFSGQLLLCLHLYGIDLSFPDALAGVFVVFLTKTIAPALNLWTDLGLREAAALWAFGPLGVSAPALLAATLTLWLVNVGAPVLAGLPGVWRLNIARP